MVFHSGLSTLGSWQSCFNYKILSAEHRDLVILKPTNGKIPKITLLYDRNLPIKIISLVLVNSLI
jgi:hypothetical protein